MANMNEPLTDRIFTLEDWRERALNNEAMADCMDMVRQELVEAGVIDAKLAPMFVANGVVARIHALKASIDKLEQICISVYTGLGLAYNLPERYLDVLCDPLEATQEQIDALIPVDTPPLDELLEAVHAHLQGIGRACGPKTFADLKATFEAYRKATA